MVSSYFLKTVVYICVCIFQVEIARLLNDFCRLIQGQSLLLQFSPLAAMLFHMALVLQVHAGQTFKFLMIFLQLRMIAVSFSRKRSTRMNLAFI